MTGQRVRIELFAFAGVRQTLRRVATAQVFHGDGAQRSQMPRHLGALSAIAMEYLRRGDSAKGLPYARKCEEFYPDALACHVILGRMLVESGDLQGGARELESAKQLDPSDPQARIALASVYAKLGREDDAARERREFLRLKEKSKRPGDQ